MKRYLKLFFLLMFCGGCFAKGGVDQPLTPAEADAIVAAEAQAKAERKAARRAELDAAEVLSEGEAILPDGSKVIIREVAPPKAEPKLAEPEVVLPSPAALLDRQDVDTEQAELKSHKVLLLSCSVYDKSLTELRWTYEGESYLAYTNADFNYLRGVHSVETETDRFDYFMGISDVSPDRVKMKSLPELPAFSAERSEYVLLKGQSERTAATAGLEALLDHYDAHIDALKVQHQRNVALDEARRRYRERNPEEREDFIVQFWVPAREGDSF